MRSCLAKLELVPDVIPALLELQGLGYQFVMVTNQDGLGTPSFPAPDFEIVQDALLRLLASQGIRFAEVLICPHLPADGCACRKPNVGLVRSYLKLPDLDRERSCVIGDRQTDLALAQNMGLKGIRYSDQPGTGIGWKEIVRELAPDKRRAAVSRETSETRITAELDLDEAGRIGVSTGIRYFDHMLEQLAKHGGFSMQVAVKGDLEVDEHHTVEDTALVLGECLRKAVGDKKGIGRYGFLLPMDEAEAKVALDLSGRAFTLFEGKFDREYVGELPTELVPHFFRSFADALGATLHIEVKGENAHHMVEAAFKGVGRCLRAALQKNGSGDLPSTKGVL